MEYRKFGDTYVVRMDRGEEILATLTALCEKENIRLAQVDALGAVDHVVVGVYDVPTKTYYKTEFNEPMEISNLCGTVSRKDGQVYLHLHVTVCGKDMIACEMVVRTISGDVDRRLDENIGLNLFKFS